MKEPNYILIPVSLCQHSLKQKRIRELQVLMTLKLMGRCGRLHWTGKHKEQVAEKIGVSIRTIEHKVKRLLSYNWIGRKKSTLYLRSFRTIVKMEKLRITGRVFFEDKDLKTFRGFTIGAFIGYLLKVRRIKTKYGSREARKRSAKKRAGNSIFPASPPYQPFANDIIRKLIGCSLSTASSYKKIARVDNYIDVKSHFEETSISIRNFKYFKQELHEASKDYQIKHIRVGNKLRKKVVRLLPDLVLSNMYFKKNRTK